MRLWIEKSAPTPVWGDARDFVGFVGERTHWSAEVTLLDGRRLLCRFVPLSGGGTLMGFHNCDHEDADVDNGLFPLRSEFAT